jgi:hypothetical protein
MLSFHLRRIKEPEAPTFGLGALLEEFLIKIDSSRKKD